MPRLAKLIGRIPRAEPLVPEDDREAPLVQASRERLNHLGQTSRGTVQMARESENDRADLMFVCALGNSSGKVIEASASQDFKG